MYLLILEKVHLELVRIFLKFTINKQDGLLYILEV